LSLILLLVVVDNKKAALWKESRPFGVRGRLPGWLSQRYVERCQPSVSRGRW